MRRKKFAVRLSAVVLTAIMAVCIDCPAASFADDGQELMIYSAENAPQGVHLVWSEDHDCDGYIVYRRSVTEEVTEPDGAAEPETGGTTDPEATDPEIPQDPEGGDEILPDEGWIPVMETETCDGIECIDTTAEDGAYYEYAVTSVTGDGESEMSAPERIVYLQMPQVTIKKVSSKKKKISWTQNDFSSADVDAESQAPFAGFEIQYSRHRTMRAHKSVTKAGDRSSYTAGKLKKNKEYYARVRSFIQVDGVEYSSAWGMTPNGIKDKVISKSVLKYKYKGKKRTLDVPVYAMQGVKDNSIMQGGCTDGKYAYFALIDNQDTTEKEDDTQKIAKVKLSTAKVVALSDFLELDHANDMTYDPENGRIVVLHNVGRSITRKRLSFVDPDTLEVTGYVDVKLPSVLPGNSSDRLSSIVGYCSVAYEPKKEQYVILISTSHNFLITDKDFNPIRFVRIDESMKTINDDWYCQGMDCTKDFVLLAESPRGSSNRKINYNLLMMYDWNGDLKCRIKVRKGYEIENVFHVGDTWYTGFYTYHTVNKKRVRSGYVYKFSNF